MFMQSQHLNSRSGFFFFIDRVPSSPDRPQPCCIAEDDLELTIFLLSPSKQCNYWNVPPL